MSRVEGRVALVTGAAQGIGFACAQRLKEEGATVLMSDLNATTLNTAAKQLGAHAIVQDVSSEQGWIDTIKSIRDTHGALHILVNNAGIEGDPAAPKDPQGAPLTDWNKIFAVNSAGVFLACKHAITLMADSGGGSIVNVSSIASLVPTPFLTAYGAAKASVQHLTQSVALHCATSGHRIRCNSVHPGQARTPMLDALFQRLAGQSGVSVEQFTAAFVAGIPMGELQEPRDVANLVLFLASDEARYVTGQAIACDGGYVLAH
ncbi:SDR family NAD(P)-dependent oxidoreductase [Steroidobacter sp.]|uniref:SDR family NAD(P)-dependent oxidoreductase n=1 Tax=Steroidobacter sp. TaxID=1978227 RepID=UPI001A3C209F|nr:SDR family oxidoreductase [Steroidobacter sp.]MBL8271694.1 SDR family oxidoreductase [Steroidobacter sp.]